MFIALYKEQRGREENKRQIRHFGAPPSFATEGKGLGGRMDGPTCGAGVRACVCVWSGVLSCGLVSSAWQVVEYMTVVGIVVGPILLASDCGAKC